MKMDKTGISHKEHKGHKEAGEKASCFEKIWEIYRTEGGTREPFTADTPKAKGDFDPEPKEGEIRVFADMKRPFAALVAERRGAKGWLIVPVSPFTVPASGREMLVGERVFQLWNACTAAKGFTERSWRVDALDAADLAEIRGALAAANPGRITDGTGAVAEYEREFLVSGGSFAPVLAGKTAARAPRPLWVRISRVAGIAATIAIGVGVIWHAALPGPTMVDDGSGVVRATGGQQADYSKHCEIEFEEFAPTAPSAAPAAQVAQEVDQVLPIKSPVVLRNVYGSTRSAGARKMMAPAKGKEVARHEALACAASAPGVCFEMAPSAANFVHAVPEEERYAEFNENEFLDPKDSPLSTFSLDVDTTSYALMRREIMDFKRLPSPNMVRLEEFVNYFRYAYPEPDNGDPLAVHCEMATCPWNRITDLRESPSRRSASRRRTSRPATSPSSSTSPARCRGTAASTW